MAPFLKISPSLPWGNGFLTLMNSAWMPRISAMRFSSVIGWGLGAALAVGARLEAAGVAWANAKEEQISNPINIGKGLGTMGALTAIVHLLLVGCKLHGGRGAS